MSEVSSAWVSPGEAARIAGCVPATIKNHDRELKPLLSANGRRMYSRAAVEAWAARRDARA